MEIPRPKITYSNPEDPWLKRKLVSGLEYMTGRGILERGYHKILKDGPTARSIWSDMARELGVSTHKVGYHWKRVPTEGPLIFIANHPFGVIDGILLGQFVSSMHHEFKFLVNEALCKDEMLNQFFLPIDFSPTKEAQMTNIATKNSALEHLQNGVPIVIFPSGGVATAPRVWKKAEDLEWKRFLIKLIHKSNATVIPIFFEGQNSRIFQIVSRISMDLRAAMLLREVTNKMHREFKMVVGKEVTYEELSGIEGKQNQLNYLRESVFNLKKEC